MNEDRTRWHEYVAGHVNDDGALVPIGIPTPEFVDVMREAWNDHMDILVRVAPDGYWQLWEES